MLNITNITEAVDAGCADALALLVNDAYRGESGEGRWTTEAHLVSGPRITVDAIVDMIFSADITLFAILGERAALGCIAITPLDNGVLELGCFAVTPTLHGRGTGKVLLKFAEDYCRRAGSSFSLACFQITVVRENAALIDFYRRRGYSVTQARKHYPVDQGVGTPLVADLDLVVMQKPV